MFYTHPLFIIFSFFLCIQLFYYLFYFIRILQYKPVEVNNNDKAVSVVICAHNEYQNLLKGLPLIFDQAHSIFEVIVVDDRSSDESYDYLMQLKAEHKNFKMIRIDSVPEHITNKKYALTLGIKAATYDHILLTDADCWPVSRHWISNMSQGLSHSPSFVLGVSQYEAKKGLLNNFIRFETLQTAILYSSFALAKQPYMGVGRNLGYIKSFFLNEKGFKRHLKLTGGDDDLFINQHATGKNTKVVLGKESLVYSKPKNTIREFFVQKKRHLAIGKYYKTVDKVKLGFYHLSQICLWGILLLTCFVGKPAIILAVGVGFSIKILIQYLFFYNSAIKFGDNFNNWFLPILELLFILYYIIIGIQAFFAKRVRWR